MSKAKVSWAFQERPVASSKMNQVVTDYITPGLPIWSFGNDAFWDPGFNGLDPGIPLAQAVVAIYGWYPYNPQKSVFDRLYLLASHFLGGVDKIADIDMSFDGGASWVPAFPSATAAPVSYGNATYAETWNLDAQVATFQWLGVRGNGIVLTTNHFRLMGFLYRSTDTPF